MDIVVYGSGVMGEYVKKSAIEKGHHIAGIIDSLGNGDHSTLKEFSEYCDIIIDFSHYNSLEDILDYATTNNKPVIIATTGHSEDQLKKIEGASKIIPIIKASNTSLGVNIMYKILEVATKLLENFDIEIIEKHHNRKMDAPSGTAKSMLEVIQNNLNRDSKLVYGREGNKKRKSEDIGVHVIRGGNIVGEHSVLFSSGDEVIEVKHEALSRKIFSDGSIKAAEFLVNKSPGLYTMKDALNL